MKRLTKITLSFFVVFLLLVGTVVAAVAETAPSYTGTVAGAQELLNSAKTASGKDAKTAALDKVAEYLAKTPVDPSSAGYSELMRGVYAEYLACAELWFADINPSLGLMKNAVSIKKTRKFLKEHPIDASYAPYAAFAAKMADAESAHAEATRAAKTAIENALPSDEYSLPINVDNNFDDKTNGSFGVANKSTNFADKTSGRDGANKYFEIVYRESSHTFAGIPTGDTNKGAVIEFDFTTFDKLPGATIKIEHGSTVNTADGSKIFPVYFGIDPSGSIVAGDWTTVIARDVIVKGEWTHFSFVYDPTTCNIDIYVDYEKIATFFSGAAGITYKMTYIRMGANTNSGSFAFDNFTVYQGTGMRTHGRLDNMAADERFSYLCAQLSNTAFSAATRLSAYESAAELIGDYYKDGEYLTEDASIRASVDQYNSFDYDAMVIEKNRVIYDKYKGFVDALLAIKRSPLTTTDRASLLNTIDAYVTIHESELSKISEYGSYLDKVNSVRDNIAQEALIAKFCDKVNKFSTSQKVIALERYYKEIEQMIVDGLELSLLDNPEFSEFARCYELFGNAPAILHNAICLDNSKRIIAVAGYIGVYTTEEEWIANYSYIDKFVTNLREVIREGNYYPDYAGVAEALEVYNPINDYFYADLQRKHIEAISSELNTFASVDSYIEKVGICAYISMYIDQNDIDENNPEMARLLGMFNTYLGEVELQKEDYAGVLEQNTSYFVNKVALLKTLTRYSDIKPVYDEAMKYYYAMNIGGDEVAAAIAEFDRLTVALAEMEKAAEALEIVALELASLEGDELYAALVECAYYNSIVDDSIEGVAESRALYVSAYAKYNDFISTANSEITDAGVAVGSVRSCCGISPIIAVIIKLIFG